MRKSILAVIALSLLANISFVGAEQIPLDENHVQLAPGVIRVGHDIAYYEGGTLKLAKCELVPVPGKAKSFQCDTTKLKVYFYPSNEDWPIILSYNNKSLRMRPKAVVGYNPVSKSVRIIANSQAFTPRSRERNVIYGSVFPGVTFISWITYEKLFQQYNISESDLLGQLHEGETYLGIMTEVDLSNLSPYRIFIQRGDGTKICDYYVGSETGSLPPEKVGGVFDHLETGSTPKSHRIRFCLADEASTMIFASQEKPAVGGSYVLPPVSVKKEEWSENRTLPKWVLKRVDNRNYLIQLVPVSWLQQVDFPVYLRTAFLAGKHSNKDEVFLPGNTYVIERTYMVKTLTSLGMVDQPVYVKFVPDHVSSIRTGRRVKPSKVEHTIFTSTYDNHPSRGAMIDPGIFGYPPQTARAGDYRCAFSGNLRTDGFIRNCQIYYAEVGLASAIDPEGETAEVKNILVEHCSEHGVYSEGGVQLTNCTIRDCNQGLELVNPEAGGQVINCIFAENKVGCNQLPATASSNAWYANTENSKDGNLGSETLSEANGLTQAPFAENTSGDCYLNSDANGGALLKDSGYGTMASLDLTDIVDSGQIDRGFHYPAVE